MTELDNLITYMNELRDIFQDSGYAGDGSNPITDSDLEALGMTAGNMAAFNLFMENINLFYHNGTPAKADYAAAVNRFRSM